MEEEENKVDENQLELFDEIPIDTEPIVDGDELRPSEDEMAVMSLPDEESRQWKEGAWSFSELTKTEFPPQPALIEGLVERGTLVILAGGPKAGKSWLSLDMAISVATGGSLFGEHDADQGDVLYLALEDTPRRLSNRLKQMIPDELEGIDHAHVRTHAPRQGEGGMNVLIDWCYDVEKPSLIVIDTLIRFRPFKTIGGGYVNDSLALIPLHELAQKANIAVVVVHHDIKASAGNWENTISGSKGLTGIADSMMLLRKPMGGKAGRFFVTGRDIEDTRFGVVFDKATARWNKTDEPDEDESDEMTVTAPTEIAVQAVFVMNPHAELTNKDIIQQTGLAEGTVKSALYNLSRAGLITKLKRGVYKFDPNSMA